MPPHFMVQNEREFWAGFQFYHPAIEYLPPWHVKISIRSLVKEILNLNVTNTQVTYTSSQDMT